MTSPIRRVRLMVGRRVMTPEMNGSIPLPATMKGVCSMNFLKRLTSVFFCCVLLSSSVFALDDSDSQDFYTLEAVEAGRASILSSVSTLASSSTTTDDSKMLEGIYKFIQYFTVAPSSFMKGSLFSYLAHIASDTETIMNNLGGISGVATESTLSALSKYFSDSSFEVSKSDTLSGLNSFLGWVFDMRPNGQYSDTSRPYLFEYFDHNTSTYKNGSFSWGALLAGLYGNLSFDGTLYNDGPGYRYSLYHYVMRLSDVLANDEDNAIRYQQKENQTTVKDSFLSGSSSGSSLGKDDFGSLSSVGGTFKDTISLNGQSSISDLTSGLSDADSVGRGWFSQSTKDSLDAVSVSPESTVSTFSDDGSFSVDVDPDPYHMAGFENNYAWLWGDD